MKLTYRRALDEVLLPLGFHREGQRDWFRRQDGLIDYVELQFNSNNGTAVNVHFDDQNTSALLEEAAPNIGGVYLANRRLGWLAGEPLDKWWKNDPDGPREAAHLLRAYGVPFLDRLHDLEFQLTQLGPVHEEGRRHTGSQLKLAMTLYRLGRFDDARHVISAPSKPLNDKWRKDLESVRRWLQEKTAGRSRPAHA